MRQFFKTLALGVAEAFTPRRQSVGQAQIVPQSSVSGRALTAVISIMSFLACLTAGVVYMVNQSANAWFNDIASEVTVQVAPRDGVDIEKQIETVAEFLRGQAGITNVRPFDLRESARLLEPWLGAHDTLSALPVPRLIAVEIDRLDPPDLAAVRQGLASRFDTALLDDHRHWQAQIRSLTRSVAIGGIGILLLVATATISVVVSAARSAMASNHEIVEVLHFVGAKRRFISSEFERHFLALGIRSGLLGAAAAAGLFAFTPFAVSLLGGGSVTASEIKQVVGSAELDVTGYLILGGIVITVAGICMFTSSYWVERILSTEGSLANPNYSMAGGFGVSSKPGRRESVRSQPGPLMRGVGVLLKSAVAMLIAFTVGFVAFASTIVTEQDAPDTSADGIVVLTGGQSRIKEAVKLLAGGKAKRLFISGVYARTSREQLAEQVPESKPLFDCCIDIGRDAQDTIGNAVETRAWAREKGFRSLIVVTSGYHMPRSIAEFRRIMPDTEFTPYSVLSNNVRMDRWWQDGDTLRLLFTEYVKYIPAMTRLGLQRVRSGLVG